VVRGEGGFAQFVYADQQLRNLHLKKYRIRDRAGAHRAQSEKSVKITIPHVQPGIISVGPGRT